MTSLLNNSWFVSVGSSLITLGIVPTIAFISNGIRARSGGFSGTYIAITTIRNGRIVELVHCKHMKNKVKGKILGVAIIGTEGREKNIERNYSRYHFKGGVAERLLVMSYSPIDKGDLSAGSLTLYGDTYGATFSGTWGGLEGGKVVSSTCVWIKTNEKLSLKKDHDQIVKIAQQCRKGVVFSDNGSGKSKSLIEIPRS